MFSGGRTSARSHSRKPENNTRIPKKLEVQVDCGLQQKNDPELVESDE